MTVKLLLWFNCKRCNCPFMSWCYGHWLNCNDHEDICFYDNTNGEIHNNSYVYSANNLRLCQRCRKGSDIGDYM